MLSGPNTVLSGNGWCLKFRLSCRPRRRFATRMPISLVGRVTKAGVMRKTVTVSVDRKVRHDTTHKVFSQRFLPTKTTF
jgi:hypothetical protein